MSFTIICNQCQEAMKLEDNGRYEWSDSKITLEAGIGHEIEIICKDCGNTAKDYCDEEELRKKGITIE